MLGLAHQRRAGGGCFFSRADQIARTDGGLDAAYEIRTAVVADQRAGAVAVAAARADRAGGGLYSRIRLIEALCYFAGTAQRRDGVVFRAG